MKKIALVGIFVLSFALLRNSIVTYYKLQTEHSRILKLKEELETQKSQNLYLKNKLKYVKTDQYIEQQAREKLNLVRDGEAVVIAPHPSPIVISTARSVVSLPNWKKWMQLFVH